MAGERCGEHGIARGSSRVEVAGAIGLGRGVSDVLFESRGGEFLPTEFARGPWSPDSLHGGPVAALLARSLEGMPAAGPMHPARLTVELLRPVPLAPLSVQVEELRPGRKVQWLEATLSAAGVQIARARMLRIRAAEVAVPDDLVAGEPRPFAGPVESAGLDAPWRVGGIVAFHSHATEHRAARGSWHEPGPITDWIRLRVGVVPGEPPSPLQRVAAVADFGNGVSSVLPFGEYLFINPDLTIHLHRLPVGEWVCLDAATLVSDGGTGLAESALWDERGRIGRSLQSLLIERR